MRKFKLMPFVLLASVFGLSACTLPKWLSFLSFIPGLEAPEEEKKEEKKEEEEEEEEEKGPTYTLASAIDAVGELLNETFQDDFSENITHDETEGDYIVVNFGDSGTSDQLEEISDTYLVPEGFKAEMEEWGDDTFSDGTPVRFIDYVCGDVVLEYCVYTVSGYEGDQAGYNGLYYQVASYDAN